LIVQKSVCFKVIDLGTGKTQGRFCGTNPPGDYVSAGEH